MADLDIRKETGEPVEDDYTMLEVALWVFGIVMIPLAPILMVVLFTPWRGF